MRSASKVVSAKPNGFAMMDKGIEASSPWITCTGSTAIPRMAVTSVLEGSSGVVPMDVKAVGVLEVSVVKLPRRRKIADGLSFASLEKGLMDVR